MNNKHVTVTQAATLWEKLIREEAEYIADQQNESEGHCGPYGTSTWKDYEADVRKHFEKVGQAYLKLNTRIEATANVEPVAWLYEHTISGKRLDFYRRELTPPSEWHETPLYAHPPVRNTDTQALLQEAREALAPFSSCASEWDGEPVSLNVEFAAYDPPRMNPSALVADFRNAAKALAKLDAALGPIP